MKPLHFLKTVFKDYRVGALTPTSRYAVERIVGHIEPHYRYVVEYGAGDGVITKKLLHALPKGAKVAAIEQNEELLRELRSIHDARLLVIRDDVVSLAKDFKATAFPEIHMVVSGIPFSFLKPAAREGVVRDTFHALTRGGKFVVYQYSPLVLPLLKKYFGDIEVSLEPRNLFPYFIMAAKKK